MEELGFGIDLVVVMATAIAGGILARRLKLPTILGYLVGGAIVGPHGFSAVRDMETVQTLATIGVVLLLFALGIEFSLKELARLGKVSILGGIAQILLTVAVGLALGKLLKLGIVESVFFGFIIAMSSTMIVLKSLMERGELDSSHGRIMIGILLVQDLSVVPLVTIIPAIGGGEGALWTSLGMAALKAAIFIAAMLLLGIKVLPWLLKRVAGVSSRELFVLSVVTLVLATAFGTHFFGLSIAFGAFVAGLLIGQSVFARQAFAEIVPLRDAFVALFFVSLGMLFNPRFALENIALILSVVAAIIAAKFVICFLIPWFHGYSLKTALYTGTGLIQIGEFSFVLAGIGREAGIISPFLYSFILASAIITMLLTPLSFSLASPLYQLSQRKGFGALMARRVDPQWQRHKWELSGHAVICGHGSVGRTLATVLERRKFPYLVIDLAPQVISELNSRGIPCIYGDASNPEILAHAELKKARVLVCTFPDFIDTQTTTRNALKINPKLDIVARVPRGANIEILKGIGISELVSPELEASLEITRHTLHRFGLTTVEIQYIINSLRKGELV